MGENDLISLFQVYAEQAEPPILELQNIDHRPVAAIYLDKFKDKGQIVVSDTNNQEKYFFYCDGIGIYFSFFKKISKR